MHSMNNNKSVGNHAFLLAPGRIKKQQNKHREKGRNFDRKKQSMNEQKCSLNAGVINVKF